MKQNELTNSGRKYKDSAVRLLCKHPQRTIEVCNAVEGTNYPLTANVQHFNIEDKLLGRYGDLICTIENQLFVLSEHMSTLNFNMPLRILQYIIDVLELVFLSKANLHSSVAVKIPTPKISMLYNGRKTKDPLPKVMRLSDAFILPDNQPALELTVKVIDISYGSGSEALAKSPTLNGYAYFIHLIESGIKAGIGRDKAIATAIERCIKENILADFLSENYGGLIDMLGYEYTIGDELRGSWLDGKEEGRQEGIEETEIKNTLSLLEHGLSIADIAKIIKRPIQWVESQVAKKL
ncbi:MAG: hypothetical protein FWG68_04835 [Defluviitaleaceae bacterium]|nr:hypothetical protein [Defluviitaleaceae bacterium]